MSLSVADALWDGLGRTFERSGLQLIGVFVVVRLVSVVATNTLNRANLAMAEELGALPGEFATGPFAGLADAPTPFALGLGLAGAYLLYVVVALLAEAARIVAVRALFTDRTDAIPAADARRRLGPATVNGFVGGLVVLTLTLVGLVLFVVPGVFLALSFLFVRQEIAVRDVNFVEAMSGSWELASGHRLDLFTLVVALFFASLVAAAPGFFLSPAAPAVGAAVGAVARAVFVVFSIASVTRAYAQLRGEAAGGDDADAAADEADPYEGALGPDDLPPPDGDDRA